MTNVVRHRRRCVGGATVVAAALAAAIVTSPATAAPGDNGFSTVPTYAVPKRAGEAPAVHAARQKAVRYLQGGVPVTLGPDPLIALTPGTSPTDAAGWAATHASAAKRRAAARAGQAAVQAPAARLRVNDAEPAGSRGFNDTIAKAQAIPAFGTAPGRVNAADISGRLSAAAKPALVRQAPNVEDDGTPERARDTGVADVRRGFVTTGRISALPPDPDGFPVDDLDWYATRLTAGQLLDVSLDVRNARPADIPFLITVFDENQGFVADSFFAGDNWEQAPRLTVPINATGRYYVMILAFGTYEESTDTFVPGTGDYTIGISARAGDIDVFTVQLKAGDVLGANVGGAAGLVGVYNATGGELMVSGQDVTFIMPAVTPLPGGGNAVADVVAPRDGAYFVSVLGGSGAYTANLEVYRPGGEGKPAQIVYLDYDGARLNTGLWGGRGVTTLSPMSAFLPKWGLQPSDRAALGRAIKATVVENIATDLRASGLSDSVDVRVVTSDESPDLWGQPHVTRIIVGGTIEESGIPTIGIAQSIDPGNFNREESGLVLLDILSSDPQEFGDASLNFYLRPRSKTLAFVAQAVGNITAHEAGHMLGNWHTDNQNSTASIMDAGGVFALLYGVGPDGVGGTADDIDTDFVTDRYDLWEGFGGRENTTAKTAWALSR